MELSCAQPIQDRAGREKGQHRGMEVGARSCRTIMPRARHAVRVWMLWSGLSCGASLVWRCGQIGATPQGIVDGSDRQPGSRCRMASRISAITALPCGAVRHRPSGQRAQMGLKRGAHVCNAERLCDEMIDGAALSLVTIGFRSG